ncbi:MAG: hypothetical protein AB7P03_31025 [Kofleriaceae bacterium]
MRTLSGFRAWWREHHRRYLAAAAITCVALVGTAMIVGLDRFIDAGVSALFAAVAFPFAVVVLLAVLVVLPFLPFVVVAAFTDTDVEDPGGSIVEDAAPRIVGGYFGWIARRRNPLFWGIPTGVLVALAVLSAIVYERDRPMRDARERTEGLLADVKDEIDAMALQHRRLPAQVAKRLDGYGRPLEYRAVNTRALSTYTVISRGANPLSPDDDLCVDGAILHRRMSVGRAIAEKLLLGDKATPISCPDQD